MKQFASTLPFEAAPHGLAAALQWLVAATLNPGDITCLGLRFDGYTAGDWKSALHWLNEYPQALVSPSEKTSAARFLHTADAVRHLAGRSLLRHIHARHSTGPAPDVWPVNEWGKPGNSGSDWPLHFNLSHSGSDVWMACSNAAPLGIDIEITTPDLADLLPVVHPYEAADLRNDSSAAACRRLWVRKEAVVKAVGRGLSLPLDDFRVAIDARTEGWLLTPPSAWPGAWTTLDLSGCGDCADIAGAVAAPLPNLAASGRLARILAKQE